MKKSCFKLFIAAFLTLFVFQGVSFSQQKKQYDSFISEDVMAFVYVPDIAGSFVALKETSLGKLLETDDMAKIANTAMKFMNAQMREKDSPVSWDELLGFLQEQAQGQCAIASFDPFEKEKNPADAVERTVLFFDVSDKGAFDAYIVKNWIMEYNLDAEKSTYRKTEYKAVSSGRKKIGYYGFIDNTVMFSENESAVKSLIDSYMGPAQNSLAKNSVYRRLKNELKNPICLSYFNGEKAVKNLEKRVCNPDALARRDVKYIPAIMKENEKRFYEFLELFGVGSLKETVYGAGIAGGNLVGKGFIHIPTPTGFASLFPKAQKGEFEALKCVPKDTMAVVTISASLPDVYENYVGILQKIYNAEVDKRLKELNDQETELGIDFQEMLDTMGDEIIQMVDLNPAKLKAAFAGKQVLNAIQFGIAVKLRNEAKFKSIMGSLINKLEKLSGADNSKNSIFTEEQYRNAKIVWYPLPLEFGHCVKNGYFIMATGELLKKTVDTLIDPSGSMAQDAEVKKINLLLSSSRKCVYCYLNTPEFLDFYAAVFKTAVSGAAQGNDAPRLEKIGNAIPDGSVFYEYLRPFAGIIYYKDDLFVIDTVLPSK